MLNQMQSRINNFKGRKGEEQLNTRNYEKNFDILAWKGSKSEANSSTKNTHPMKKYNKPYSAMHSNSSKGSEKGKDKTIRKLTNKNNLITKEIKTQSHGDFKKATKNNLINYPQSSVTRSNNANKFHKYNRKAINNTLNVHHSKMNNCKSGKKVSKSKKHKNIQIKKPMQNIILETDSEREAVVFCK